MQLHTTHMRNITTMQFISGIKRGEVFERCRWAGAVLLLKRLSAIKSSCERVLWTKTVTRMVVCTAVLGTPFGIVFPRAIVRIEWGTLLKVYSGYLFLIVRRVLLMKSLTQLTPVTVLRGPVWIYEVLRVDEHVHTTPQRDWLDCKCVYVSTMLLLLRSFLRAFLRTFGVFL